MNYLNNIILINSFVFVAERELRESWHILKHTSPGGGVGVCVHVHVQDAFVSFFNFLFPQF